MSEKTLTCGETMLLLQALQELSLKAMKPKLAFWIARTLREIEPIARTFEEQRIKLIDKYAVRNETGDYVFSDRESGIVQLQDGFWGEYDELLQLEGAKIKTCDEKMITESLEDTISPSLVQKLMVAVEDI